MKPLLVALGAAMLSTLVIWLRLRYVRQGLDQPGARSLHSTPTPHGGGLGIVLAALLAGLAAGVGAEWLAGIALLAGLSLVDDWQPLAFWLRLPIHLLAAAGVVFLAADLAWWAWLSLAVLIAWTTNAYNFMDGADGLAGTMAGIGFAAYAVVLFCGGFVAEATLCAAVAGASAGFLLFNWPPARIFMGDVGSIPLGFLAGGLGWHGVELGAWQAWFALLVFSPFLLDATLTLLRRALRGERVWEAHRQHLYQQMVRGGLSHAAMSSRWLVVMLCGALLALVLHTAWPEAGWAGLLLWWAVLVATGWRLLVKMKD